jgi:hypothetical protein
LPTPLSPHLPGIPTAPIANALCDAGTAMLSPSAWQEGLGNIEWIPGIGNIASAANAGLDAAQGNFGMAAGGLLGAASPGPGPRGFGAAAKNLTIERLPSIGKRMADKFIAGRPTRPLVDRMTGRPIGKITTDGSNRVVRYPHKDRGTPRTHWNLEDKQTDRNIHVIVGP